MTVESGGPIVTTLRTGVRRAFVALVLVLSGTAVAAPAMSMVSFRGDSLLAARGITGLATKAAAREAAAGLGLPEAQARAVQSAIGRATTSSTVDIVQDEGGNVLVRVVRPGANGYQAIESTVTQDGVKTVVQKAYDAAGRLVHFDPKTP